MIKEGESNNKLTQSVFICFYNLESVLNVDSFYAPKNEVWCMIMIILIVAFKIGFVFS